MHADRREDRPVAKNREALASDRLGYHPSVSSTSLPQQVDANHMRLRGTTVTPEED